MKPEKVKELRNLAERIYDKVLEMENEPDEHGFRGGPRLYDYQIDPNHPSGFNTSSVDHLLAPIIKILQVRLEQAEREAVGQCGWLIEREGPTWMFVRSDRQIDWTSDSVKAVRFARREDAEAVLFAFQLQSVASGVTEHRWGL